MRNNWDYDHPCGTEVMMSELLKVEPPDDYEFHYHFQKSNLRPENEAEYRASFSEDEGNGMDHFLLSDVFTEDKICLLLEITLN